MTNDILKLEKEFCDLYREIPSKLKVQYDAIKNLDNVSLDTKEFSEAILLRLITYYSTQNEIKALLDKRYSTPGADFFVETVLFYLKVILEKLAPNLKVHSEKAIQNKRGSIRPDISVWKGDEVIAIIECKTQLGWNRNRWEQDFNDREIKLKNAFENAKAYLLVMSLSNWPGFGNSPNIGEKYFALSKDWPGNISDKDNLIIENPFEPLFKKLVNNN